MNTRAFLGAFAALSLAAACSQTAEAAVQVSQSGWQWGNPTPQGNTIRAMDFIAGRGYAIGDDGTALRTDDGGASWTGLATGTSQDLSRLQAVTPDVVVVLGGDGCVVRRSDDGGATFHKMFVLAETNCPDRVAASFFVTPQVGYLLLRDGNVLRTTDGGQTFGRGTAVPGTPASAAGGQGTPADAIFTTTDAGIVFLNGTNTAFKTTDAGASWTPVPAVEPGSVTRMRAISPTAFYAFGPDTLLRSSTAASAGRSARAPPAARSPASAARPTTSACSPPTRATSSCAPRTAARRRRRSRPAPPRSTRPASPTSTARSRSAPAARRSSPTTAARTTCRSAATSRARSSSACGSARRPRSRSRSAPAASSRARPTTALTWKAINVATSADMQDTSFTTADNGYALDQRGGLFRTAQRRRELAADRPGHDVRAQGRDRDRRHGPAGRPARHPARGRPAASSRSISTKPVRGIAVDQFDRGGNAIFAYGATTIVRTTNGGRSWTAIKGPSRKRGKKTVRAAAA